jgi:NitT/TauT family transport system substrate-binding protein
MKRSEYLAGAAASAAIFCPAVIRAQTKPVRIASAYNDAYALSYFARDGGFFKSAGIDVDIQLFPNTQVALQAVATGSLDIAVADAVQIGNAVNNGVEAGFFAPSSVYTSTLPTTLICVAKDGPIKTPKDLEGRTVGVVALRSLMCVGLEEFLRQNGVDDAKVKQVELNFPVMEAAVVRGTVDAVILAEPFISAAAADTRILGDPLGAIAKNFLLSGQIAMRKWISDNRDLASKLAKVYAQTAAWANSHHDETANFLATYSNVPAARIREIRRATFGTTLTASQLQPVLDSALKYGSLQKAVRAQNALITV